MEKGPQFKHRRSANGDDTAFRSDFPVLANSKISQRSDVHSNWSKEAGKTVNTKNWSCRTCTYSNHPDLAFCEMCEASKM